MLLMSVFVLFAMQAEAATLVNNSNGTVTDKDTGLMWQKQDDGRQYNWHQAKGTVCRALKTGKYSDWRLPSKDELATIVDKSAPQSGPAIKTSFFPGTMKAGYWSSTTDAVKPDFAWLVDFAKGHIIPAVDKRNHWHVRCVRGGQ
jgi:hypothetical protein